MSKFKKGDKVKIRKDSIYFDRGGQLLGVGSIQEIRHSGTHPYYVGDGTMSDNYREEDLELVKINHLTPLLMSITDAIKALTIKEPQKTYVALDVTDKEGKLTEEGESAFLNHLFETSADKDSPFFKQCSDVLKEQQKQAKK